MMSDSYEIYLSLNGHLIIRDGESLNVFTMTEYGIVQSFTTDIQLHGMILFPLKKIPKKFIKRHKEKILSYLMRKD